MTAPMSVAPAVFLREQLASASPDLLREMVKTFADALMSAEADSLCGAAYDERGEERTNSRNGYRTRDENRQAASRRPSTLTPHRGRDLRGRFVKHHVRPGIEVDQSVWAPK